MVLVALEVGKLVRDWSGVTDRAALAVLKADATTEAVVMEDDDARAEAGAVSDAVADVQEDTEDTSLTVGV